MGDLITRLRNFEGSDALGNGDFSLMAEAAAALEATQEEVDRLQTKVRDLRDTARTEFALHWEQKARAERLAEVLREARVAVEGWGEYADPYFQDKHDLQGDLDMIDAALQENEHE